MPSVSSFRVNPGTGQITASSSASSASNGTGLATANPATVGVTAQTTSDVTATTLTVTGLSTLAAVNGSGTFTLNGSGTGLSVTNDATVGGKLTSASMQVTGTCSLNNLTMTGELSLTSAGTALAVTNNASFGGTVSANVLNASGPLTASGSNVGLAVTNNVTIGGTLAVTGALSGSTVTMASTPPFTNTAMYTPNTVLLNGLSPTTVFQTTHPANYLTCALVTGVAVPSTSTAYEADGFSSYVTNASTTTGACAGSFYSLLAATGATVWALNPLVDDEGYQGVVMGAEFDIGSRNLSSQAYGINMIGVFPNGTPSTAVAYQVAALNPSPWQYGFVTGNGSCQNFALIATKAATTASSDSQPLVFSTRDDTNTTYQCTLQAQNAHGTCNFAMVTPSGGGLVLSGNLLVSGSATLSAGLTAGSSGNTLGILPGSTSTSAIAFIQSGTGGISFSGKLSGMSGVAGAQTGVFTNTQMNVPYTFLLNGISPSTIYSGEQSGKFATQALVGGVAIPSNSAVNDAVGVAAYVTNASTATNAVGFSTIVQATVSGTHLFGLNPLVDDMGLATTVIGCEWDIGGKNTGSTVYGNNMIGVFDNGTPSTAIAYQVSALNHPWGWAFLTRDGSASTAMLIGSQTQLASSDSQWFTFNTRDNNNATVQVSLVAQHGSNGAANLAIVGGTGLVIGSGSLLVSGTTSLNGVTLSGIMSGGTIENFAIAGTITGNAAFSGNLTISGSTSFSGATSDTIISKGSAKTLTDTSGYMFIPYCAGQPTGVPTNAAYGIALMYDTTNHKLWAYDNISNAWKGVALA